jgi:hypothetical protein
MTGETIARKIKAWRGFFALSPVTNTALNDSTRLWNIEAKLRFNVCAFAGIANLPIVDQTDCASARIL